MSATAEATAGPRSEAAKGWSLPPWWEKALFPLFILAAILFPFFFDSGGSDQPFAAVVSGPVCASAVALILRPSSARPAGRTA